MPSKNPRINVVMPSSLHSTISRLADIRGESRSAIIREVLEMLEPTLERTAATLEKLDAQERYLKAQKTGAEVGLKNNAESILENAEKEMAPFLQAMENMFSEFEKLPTDTPHCNTGYSTQPNVNSQGQKGPKVQELRADWHGDCKR